MHAWDCSCGTRNAPTFRTCRRCGLSASKGAVVASSTIPQSQPGVTPRANKPGAPVPYAPRPALTSRRQLNESLVGGFILFVVVVVVGCLVTLGERQREQAAEQEARARLQIQLLEVRRKNEELKAELRSRGIAPDEASPPANTYGYSWGSGSNSRGRTRRSWSGGTTHVRSYTRRDGTRVRAHTRRR